jgi:hypothetical protein
MAFNNTRGLRGHADRRRFGAVTLAMAGAVYAQEAPAAQSAPVAADEVEAVVVTGFRASLASAINVKRNASGVVDAIKAEDIAQFPDLNLAESLQRIPGVSISRINGEGRQISVRGLGSEYTRVRINGMEAITTTGGTANSGGTNRGRGFDFNIFASDLFNSIAVRKTASADVEEGSLGATVDLNTARPFDSRQAPARAVGPGQLQRPGAEGGPRLSALASRTWRDGTPAPWSRWPTRSATCSKKAPTSRAGPTAAATAASTPPPPCPATPSPRSTTPNATTGDLPPAHPGLCQLRHRHQALRGQRLAAVEADRQHHRLGRRALFLPGRHPQGSPDAGDRPVARRRRQAADHHPRRHGGRRQQQPGLRQARQRRSAHPVGL